VRGGQILAALGVLDNGEVDEVTRSQLVGEYLGHTAPRTRDAFTKATGGVLFIDEAYALSRKFGANADFGVEAIDELVTLMENRREDVVVIVAGYTEEMNTFLDANPGLRSRFSRTIEFPPYSPAALAEITELIAGKASYRFDEPVPDNSASTSSGWPRPASRATPARRGSSSRPWWSTRRNGWPRWSSRGGTAPAPGGGRPPRLSRIVGACMPTVAMSPLLVRAILELFRS
jgi:ATPase family protein associated with various cellular activities (AAA)